MPLVINALGGRHADTHRHIPTCEPKQCQEISCASAANWCVPGLKVRNYVHSNRFNYKGEWSYA